MTPKEEINLFIDKLSGSREEMLSLIIDYGVTIDIEDKYNLDKQVLYSYVAGLTQVLIHVKDENIQKAIEDFRDSEVPFYELINKYK